MFFRKLLERLFRRINFLRRIEAQSPRALFLANRGSALISKSRSKITLFGRVSFGFPLTDRTLFSALPKTVLFLGENSSITFLGNASIAQGVSIMVGKNASVVIGDGVTIAHNTQVLCNKHISIGAGSTISWNALLIRILLVIRWTEEISGRPRLWVLSRPSSSYYNARFRYHSEMSLETLGTIFPCRG